MRARGAPAVEQGPRRGGNGVARGQPPSGASRFGYLVAIGLNGVTLWVAHRLLDWGWPGFVTGDFERLLPMVTAALVASIVANVCFLVRDNGMFRVFADLVTAALGLAAAVRTWTVFPFDFSDYSYDWSWVARLMVVLAIVGTAISVLVSLGKLGGFRGGGASSGSPSGDR